MANVIFNTKSILGFLTAVSLLAWLGGIGLKAVNESIGSQLENIGFPIFAICFAIWLVFVFMSIARNLGAKF